MHDHVNRLALLVSTLLKFILGQSCIYTTGLYKFDMLDLYAGIIPTDCQLCTLICSFFQHFINLNCLMVFNNFNFEFLLFQRLGVLHLFTCFIY